MSAVGVQVAERHGGLSAMIATLASPGEAAAAGTDWLVAAVRALAGEGRIGHALSLGPGSFAGPVVRESWDREAAFPVSVVAHDPAKAITFVNSLGEPIATIGLVVSVAPAVVRVQDGKRRTVHDPASIALASLRSPDLIEVAGLPTALGGRAGSLRQAFEMAPPGGILVVPDLAASERAEVAAWLGEVAERFPGTDAEVVRVGVAEHLLVGLGEGSR